MTDVLLATCSDLPDGEDGGDLIVDAFERRGIGAAWASWDDPRVEWGAARLVAVRSTWDYSTRREEFLAWARSVEETTRLVNPARVLEWNTDKAYLVDLAATALPVVPTLTADDEGDLGPAIASFATAVVKPRVGASGRGVVLFDGRPGGPDALDESQLWMGPWVVQPLVESIRTEGELSVFVFGGEPVSMARKLPAGEEIRVHEEYGGSTVRADLTEEAATLARRSVTTAEDLLGLPLPYARADLMRLDDGTLALSELEVTEPGLYLDVVPENAEPFAATMAGLLQS